MPRVTDLADIPAPMIDHLIGRPPARTSARLGEQHLPLPFKRSDVSADPDQAVGAVAASTGPFRSRVLMGVQRAADIARTTATTTFATCGTSTADQSMGVMVAGCSGALSACAASTQNRLPPGSAKTIHPSAPVWPMSARVAPNAIASATQAS